MSNKASRVATEKKPFCKRLLSLSGRFNTWEVWADFITLFAIAISNRLDKAREPRREEMYLRIIGKYNAKEREVFPLLVADVVQALDENSEQDFLGSAYMELELGNHWAGQFFTPYDVCRVMAGISLSNVAEEIEHKGYITVNDCACGAGATLIAAAHEIGQKLHEAGVNLRKGEEKLTVRNWQNHVLFTAQDIDFVAGMMCYIQLSLIGAAGYIKIGNTLTDPMRDGDSKENYWYMPMYFSDTWQLRRICHNVAVLISE